MPLQSAVVGVLMVIAGGFLVTGHEVAAAAVWGQWSNWFCNVPCRAVGVYVRTRSCHVNPPDPLTCRGHFSEATGLCNNTTIMCPHECPNGSWGMGCRKQCSFTCLDRLCDVVSGVCKSCQQYHIGDYCQLGCVKGSYGQSCEKTCGQLCIRGCNLNTGQCFSDITIFTLVVFGMVIASFAPVVVAYHKYCGTDELNELLRPSSCCYPCAEMVE